MTDYDWIPCWRLDLLPEKIAREYMSTHIRLVEKTIKSKKVNFSKLEQYSLNFVT